MTTDMHSALNNQIEKESYASHLYLSMATWLDNQGLEGGAQFMFRQSDEEREHMLKIVHYLLEMDQKATVPSIDQPPVEFASVQEVFDQAYAHEQSVTASINKLVDQSIKDNDHATNNFLQWYIAEQREEEALMRTIMDKIKIIGDGPQSLYFIDKELEIINEQEESEEDDD